MGCGSIIYKVVKVIVIAVANYYFPYVGGMIASAMFTLIEGGSFKDALVSAAISGASTYAGNVIGEAVSSSASALSSSAAADTSAGVTGFESMMGGEATFGEAVSAVNPDVVGQGLTQSGLTGQTVGNALETGLISPASATLPILTSDAAFVPDEPGLLSSLNENIRGPGQQGALAPEGGISDIQDPNLIQQGIGELDALSTSVKSFADPIVGPIGRVGKSLAEVYDGLVSLPILEVLPKYAATQATQIDTYAQLIGLGANAVTQFTVGQALDAQLEGLGEAIETEGGYPRGGFDQLSEIHRRTKIAVRFDEIIAETDNPFITPEMEEAAFQQATDEFNAVIATGLDIRNQQLGANITQEQFDASFNEPDLGQTLLANEQAARQRDYGETLNQAFPGDAFQDIDDDIISSIVDERQAGPSSIISNVQARGTLNPLGGQTATKFLESQVPEATAKVGQAAQGIGAGYQQDIFDIRDRAQSEIGEYKLGDPLFDVAPFAQERGDLLAEQQGTFPSDIRAATTDVPLFDINAAINRAGSRQGLVSGTPAQAPLLDTLAAREAAAKRSDRGASSTGSGTF